MSFFSSSSSRPTGDYIDRDREEDGGASKQAHFPTRPVNRDKAEQQLVESIKKSTSPDESAPKQKHARKLIVYSWDYHSSNSIWSALRVQPILSDEVQTFKALIIIHKLLQEGHPSCIKEGQNQTGWLETCSRTIGGDVSRGYGSLIRAYVILLLAKLKFHRLHPDFNGLFEYEEYISLRGVDDPNEGYETISDLMNLQDQIDSFQKLIFAHFRGAANNECRISALVPQVKESYGIYRFITSMLRAMHRRMESMDALEPLRDRYNSQHSNIRKFYYECSNLKYLTGLINVPKLPLDAPNLLDSGEAPDLPSRPTIKSTPTETIPTRSDLAEQQKMLAEYESQQALLLASRSADLKKLEESKLLQQRNFEEQQRLQLERERLAQEELNRQQAMQFGQQNQGRIAELEREILALRGEYERNQIMLERYDNRVKALEGELSNISIHFQQQLASNEVMIQTLTEQTNLWKLKYESLAKLYSQLRNEHLEMLSKYKVMQLKANSAQESIDKMERMERDGKNKNLELADMIKERDRARFDLDRLKSNQKEELERVKRDLRFAEERAEDFNRSKGSEVSSMMNKYNRQLEELETSLESKQLQIDSLLLKISESDAEFNRMKEEKEEELLIMQEGMDVTIRQYSELQTNQGENDDALNAQIDTLVLDQEKKFNEIIDSILLASSQKIEQGLYELESSLFDGNSNSTVEFTLVMIEKAMESGLEFSRIFCLYLSREIEGSQVLLIKSANEFSHDLVEVLMNSKGLSGLLGENQMEDILKLSKKIGEIGLFYFNSLLSYKLQLIPINQRKSIVNKNNSQSKDSLLLLSTKLESLLSTKMSTVSVEDSMESASNAIELATKKLQQLIKSSNNSNSKDLKVHQIILNSALAITNAITKLIKAATKSQLKISQSSSTSTDLSFYKKNNRWTLGLISAAQAIAYATTTLIEIADGVISEKNSLEQLIVASNQVASSTAQLVQASRVKSTTLYSTTQQELEFSAKDVINACKYLVKQVKEITTKQLQITNSEEDYNGMAIHEFKVKEMEVQVSILTLEKELVEARRKLGEMRRSTYHDVDGDV